MNTSASIHESQRHIFTSFQFQNLWKLQGEEKFSFVDIHFTLDHRGMYTKRRFPSTRIGSQSTKAWSNAFQHWDSLGWTPQAPHALPELKTTTQKPCIDIDILVVAVAHELSFNVHQLASNISMLPEWMYTKTCSIRKYTNVTFLLLHGLVTCPLDMKICLARALPNPSATKCLKSSISFKSVRQLLSSTLWICWWPR